MTIVCVITAAVELFLLVTLAGVLVTLIALFSVLELMIMNINPVCLYLVRQSGQVFTCLIVLTIRRTLQIPGKMYPSSTNEQIQEPIVATIEPLYPEIEINLPNPHTTYLTTDIPTIDNSEEEANNDDGRSHQSEEIQNNTLDPE